MSLTLKTSFRSATSHIPPELTPSEEVSKPTQLLNFQTNKLQQRLTSGILDQEKECLVHSAASDRYFDHLHYLQGQGARAWVNAIPSLHE